MNLIRSLFGGASKQEDIESQKLPNPALDILRDGDLEDLAAFSVGECILFSKKKTDKTRQCE